MSEYGYRIIGLVKVDDDFVAELNLLDPRIVTWRIELHNMFYDTSSLYLAQEIANMIEYSHNFGRAAQRRAFRQILGIK